MTKIPLGDSMSQTTSGVDANDNDGWHVEAVLGPEYTAPVHTVDVVFDVIVDRRHTSRLVQDLQRLSPIPSLRHLKRVCPDGRILIRLATEPARSQSSSSGNDSLPLECNKKRAFSETVKGCDSELQDESMNEEQFSSTSKSPLHEEQNAAEGACAGVPGLDTQGLRGLWGRCAVPASPPLTRAQFAHAQRLWSCNFHPARGVEAALAPGAGLAAPERRSLLRAMRQCYQAATQHSARCTAAALHPCDGSLVALAVDARNKHPLQHAAMRLVDLVARTQGGGVWSQLSGEEVKNCTSNTSGEAYSPYLCTGLDIVVTHEPCAMCAMALTHARARRVFFSEDNPNGGVLYSRSPPLHTLPGLNHRLQVFRAFLPEEKRS